MIDEYKFLDMRIPELENTIKMLGQEINRINEFVNLGGFSYIL